MKRRRALPAPLAAALKRADTMLPAVGLGKHIGRVQDVVETLEKRYQDLLSSRDRALRQLRAENLRLRQRLRELNLEKTILQDVARRNFSHKQQERLAIDYIVARYGLDARQARYLLGRPRRTLPNRSYKKKGSEWQLSLRDRARLWAAQGYRQVNVVIQKQGWSVGRHLAWRVYVDEPRKQIKKQARKLVTTRSSWLRRLKPPR